MGYEYCYTRYWNETVPLSGFGCNSSPLTQTVETTLNEEEAIQESSTSTVTRSSSAARASSSSHSSSSNLVLNEATSATSDTFTGVSEPASTDSGSTTSDISTGSTSSSLLSASPSSPTSSTASSFLSASPSRPTSSTASSSSPSNGKQTGLDGGEIAAIVVGGLLLGFLSWLLYYWLTTESRERRRQERDRLRQDRLNRFNGAPSHTSLPSNTGHAPSVYRLEELSPNHSASHHDGSAGVSPAPAQGPPSQADSRPRWSVFSGGFGPMSSALHGHPTNMSPQSPPSLSPSMLPRLPPRIREGPNAMSASGLHVRQ